MCFSQLIRPTVSYNAGNVSHIAWTILGSSLQPHPHLRLYRWPSYSPQLNVIERFWRVLRRRATHNRLCTSRASLRATLWNNLCYVQTMRRKVLSWIESPRKVKKKQS